MRPGARELIASFRIPHRLSAFSPLFAAAALCLAIASNGCSSQPPQVTIENPSAELSPDLWGVCSVFMTIRNEGGRDAVDSVTVSVPGALVELHDVKERRMVKVRSFSVPGHGSAELKPGGPHIMVFNMPKNMREGTNVELTLHFERSGERKVPVRLEKARELPADRR